MNTVSCTNCNANMFFSIDHGTKCQNCLEKKSAAEYVAGYVRNLGYSVGQYQKTISFGEMANETLGQISLRPSEGAIYMTVCSLKKSHRIYQFLKTLDCRIILTLSEIEARSDNCPLCLKRLEFHQTTDDIGYIGCNSVDHCFMYSYHTTWLGSTLAHQYEDLAFHSDHLGLYVYQVTKVAPLPKFSLFKRQTKREEVKTTLGLIRYLPSGKTLAVWVPKEVNTKVPGIISYLRSQDIANTKIVLTNN